MTRRARRSGTRWRLDADTPEGRFEAASDPTASKDYLAAPPTVFPHAQLDEIVVDSWFHLEHMGGNHWWMSVAGLHINLRVNRDGRAQDVLVEMSDPQPGVTYQIAADDHTPDRKGLA